MRLEHVGLDDERVQGLIALHLAEMRGTTPAGFSFALDASGLAAPDITVFGAWEGERLLGIAAIKEWESPLGRYGEVKSMRTDPTALRRGVGTALLRHIVAVARERGYVRVSLETGTKPLFDAAVALYLAHGFVPGEAFGDYQASPHNQFFHRSLASG